MRPGDHQTRLQARPDAAKRRVIAKPSTKDSKQAYATPWCTSQIYGPPGTFVRNGRSPEEKHVDHHRIPRRDRVRVAPGAGAPPSVDALHADGCLSGSRDPDHRQGGWLLRLGRARQAVPRRALRAVLREHRPRPRRRRPGGRRPGQGARLLHELVLCAPARDRAGHTDRRLRPRRPQPRVLHERRRRGRRVGSEARPPIPQADRQADQAQGHRAGDRLPRDHPRRALGDRDHEPASAVRAADSRRLSRPQHQSLPAPTRRQRVRPGREDRRADRVRGARYGRGRDPRARSERGRLLHASRGLLPASPRDLR